MSAYLFRRLLLIVPTLLGILLINFLIIQAAPGGPVERTIARMQGLDGSAASRMGSGSGSEVSGASASGSGYRGAQGLPPELIADIEKQYGWSTLIIYLISIPLGIRKALHNGSSFDLWTSSAIIVGYAIPGFLFAILLIILFAGGSYWQWFPMQGLTSENFDTLSFWAKAAYYAHHIFLPTLCLTIGGFATLTILTKNSFLDEIGKQYVMTARAKGLTENQVLYGHVFRNAMLIIIAGLPATLIGVFFTGSLLIEVIFNLDGLGLLSFEAVLNRDYPVVFGTLWIFTLVGLLLKILSDIVYTLVDPRIDFESRG